MQSLRPSPLLQQKEVDDRRRVVAVVEHGSPNRLILQRIMIAPLRQDPSTSSVTVTRRLRCFDRIELLHPDGDRVTPTVVEDQFTSDDPLYIAHVMVWAYCTSNYRSRLNGLKTFIKGFPQISASYEKYQAKLSFDKPRPEEAIPTLEGVLRFAEEGKHHTPHGYAAKKMKKQKNGGPSCERAGCPNAVSDTELAPAVWGLHLKDREEKFYLCRDCKETLDAGAITVEWNGLGYTIEENYDSIDVENL